MSVLNQLVEALRDGSIRVVDLTQPLGPDTPVIGLPDIFGQSPGLTMDVISRYDDAGPAWYWNTLNLGEHTGTHFDAPVHWVTGETAKIAEAEAKRYISEAEEQKRKSEAAKAARRAGRHRQNLTGLKAAYSASQGQDENAHLDTAEDEASDG